MDGGTAESEREGVSITSGVKTERFVMGVLNSAAFIDKAFSALNAEQMLERRWSDLMRNDERTTIGGG